jgi:Cd2+/Zn2+-exporting ATPase
MDICPDEACVLTDDGEEIMDAEDVEVGSTIVIRPGERVPVDSVVCFGSADIDTSSMTGEPLPRSVSEGSELSSGFIVLNGLLHAKTVRTSDNSAAARVLALVENANENKSSEEKFITKFSRYYTPIVVINFSFVELHLLDGDPVYTQKQEMNLTICGMFLILMACG